MKILVTGSKGMLGTDLLRLLSPDHDAVGRDLDEVDIADREAVNEQIVSLAPDLVINAAAFTDVDGCERLLEDAFRANALGVENLALTCRQCGIRLIHVSTDYVFDGKKKAPYREEDPTNPLGVYGRSKLEGEQRAKRVLPDVCIVRTAWLYGKTGKNFVEAIRGQAETKKSLNVVVDQRGSPTFTKDLAEALKVIAEKALSGIYHVTNQGACSWHEFAEKILALTGRSDVRIHPISTEELGRPAPRPENSILDCTKYQTGTGMHMRSWQEALQAYLTG